MMKKNYWIASILVLLQCLISTPEASASSRASKKIGLSVGLVSSPFPSLVGYNLSFNALNFLRLTAGYGSISVGTNDALATYTADLKTIAFDAKGFLLDWNFAPFVCLGYTSVSGTITGTTTAGGTSLASTGSSIYYGGGLDWQTNIGFNLGFEYKMATISSNSIGLPGVYFGWYF